MGGDALLSSTMSPGKAKAPGALKVRTGWETGTDKGRTVYQRGCLLLARTYNPLCPPGRAHTVSLQLRGFFSTVEPPDGTLQRQFPVEL